MLWANTDRRLHKHMHPHMHTLQSDAEQLCLANRKNE